MAHYRFQLAQIFLQLSNAGGKDFLRPVREAFEQGEKNATEHKKEGGTGTEHKQPVVPEQDSETCDGEQRADKKKKKRLCTAAPGKQVIPFPLLLFFHFSYRFHKSFMKPVGSFMKSPSLFLIVLIVLHTALLNRYPWAIVAMISVKKNQHEKNICYAVPHR